MWNAPSSLPHYVKVAYDEQAIYDHITPTELSRQTRYWLREGDCDEPHVLELIQSLEKTLDELDVQDLGLHRRLLQLLAHSKKSQQERQRLGVAHIIEHIEFYSGWSRLCEDKAEYQLAEDEAWWRPGNLFENEKLRQELRSEKQLLAHGFFKLAQESYRMRIKDDVIQTLLLDPTRYTLLKLAALVSLYTEEKARALKINQVMSELMTGWNYRSQRSHTAIPMKPLYSLPVEANNIKHFYLSRSEELTKQPGGTVSGPLPRARVKVYRNEQQPERAQMALFDTDLVLKSSGQPDSFITLDFERYGPDAVQTLVSAMRQFDVEASVFEHLPRIVAGMFTAAHLDKRLQLGHSGSFWDTESGYRLCQLVGFNPDNHKHRKRVQDARELLTQFVLHREILTKMVKQGSSQRTSVSWSGVLLQPLKEHITLRIEDRYGLSEKHTFQSWLLASELWHMTQLEEDGGTPAFMLIDRRAFELDERSSVPFNIYWTLVNRAHIAGHDMDSLEPFSLKFATLYKWAALEHGSSPRMGRLAETIRLALNLMVEQGLLIRWFCEDLEEPQEGNLNFKEIQEKARLEVVFSKRDSFDYPQLLSP